jgi:hypothetical protein
MKEKKGVIYFSITSDSIMTGEKWISRLENKDICVSKYTKSVLLSKSFRPASDIIYEIAILKGALFNDNERITANIRKEAKRRKYSTPKAEIACLIREKFSDKELEAMGLHWLITMHTPIKDSDGDLSLLGSNNFADSSCLSTFYGDSSNKWGSDSGFVFVVRQDFV